MNAFGIFALGLIFQSVEKIISSAFIFSNWLIKFNLQTLFAEIATLTNLLNQGYQFHPFSICRRNDKFVVSFIGGYVLAPFVNCAEIIIFYYIFVSYSILLI